MLPAKTMLAAGTFVGLMLLPLALPQLAAYRSVDGASVAKVWDLPLPALPELNGMPSIDNLRAERAQALASQILVDPKRQLDHFYDSLLRGGKFRCWRRRAAGWLTVRHRTCGWPLALRQSWIIGGRV